LYLRANYVGKSSDQVGRLTGNEIKATDGGVFEKISQALNSSYDLISKAYLLDTSEFDHLTLICPVLVIPDSTLWQVKYDDDGTCIGSAEQTDHVAYFTGNQWTVGPTDFRSPLLYSISHLEIMTFSYLKSFVDYLWEYMGYCESEWKGLTERPLRT
jgi:hypothetical protein